MKKLGGIKLLSLILMITMIFSHHAAINTVAQQPLIVSTDNALYFWRVDPSKINIVSAHIFPQMTLGDNLENLGNAWVVWDINTTNGLLGFRSMYRQGKITQFGYTSETYDNISWFNLQDNLIFIGVVGNRTRIAFYLSNGQTFFRDIFAKTADHQLFASDNDFFIYANNTSTGQRELYTLANQVNIVAKRTQDQFITAGIRGAVIQHNSTSRYFYSGQGANITVPNDISNNLSIGHVGLVPTVFDLSKQKLWIPSTGDEFNFPENDTITGINFFGMQSSVIRSKSSAYELNVFGEWQNIGNFSITPFDYAVIDIGLYLGPVLYHGLGLVTSGFDNDHDQIPDTMEDYFGSLSTTNDTDHDGISDKVEISVGLNPAINDRAKDYDHDRLTNYEEVKLGLDPYNPDSDYGGALDGWEVKYGFNPMNKTDDQLDPDHDGVTNAFESLWNSNPYKSDTDGDGLPDSWEIKYGIDPTVANANQDPDHDGRTNKQEYQDHTDPLVKDPKSLFEGAYSELITVILLSLPIAAIIWVKYPRIPDIDKSSKNIS